MKRKIVLKNKCIYQETEEKWICGKYMPICIINVNKKSASEKCNVILFKNETE